MNKIFGVFFMTGVFIVSLASTGYAEVRVTTYPYMLNFDDNSWTSNLCFIVNNATCTHVTSGCYSGGCAKFTPPTVAAPSVNGRYSGLGGFNIPETRRLNVRVLVKIGPTYESTSDCQQNKFIIGWPKAGTTNERPMVIFECMPYEGVPGYSCGRYYSFGACEDNDCTYQCGGRTCSRPNCYDTFRSTDYHNKWFSIEMEHDAVNGIANVYIFTQDGKHKGLYVSRQLRASSGGIFNLLQIVGGFFNGTHSADANNYLMFDNLAISNTYIGPPEEFLSGVSGLGSPQNLRIIPAQ